MHWASCSNCNVFTVFSVSLCSEWFWGLTWWKQFGEGLTAKISSSLTSWEQPALRKPQGWPPRCHPPVQRNDANTGRCGVPGFLYLQAQVFKPPTPHGVKPIVLTSCWPTVVVCIITHPVCIQTSLGLGKHCQRFSPQHRAWYRVQDTPHTSCEVQSDTEVSGLLLQDTF